MTDSEIRKALDQILFTLSLLVPQVNEVTNSDHAIRTAIAESDPELTAQIYKKYQALVIASKPQVEEALRGIEAIRKHLGVKSDS